MHASGPAQYMQLAIGVVTLALVATLAWILAGPWAAVIATALVALYWPLVVATRTFLSEPLGALVLVAAVGAAVLARRRFGEHRELLAIAAAGVVGGIACLTRGDLAVGMGVIALALALAGRPDPAHGGWCAAGCISSRCSSPCRPGSSTPRTWRDASCRSPPPDPTPSSSAPICRGRGLLVPTEEQLAPEVCRHFPSDCGRYWEHSAAPVFRLIQARHPGLSQDAAVNKENLENIRKYMLGKPAAFTSMLWSKFWKMWVNVWSGGNGTYHPSTNQPQHTIYLLLAWIGLLAGIALTRRFALIVSAAVLLSIAALATLFNDQPRYNVSLMALLLCSGVAGAWLAGERLLAMRRERRAEPTRAPATAR